MAGLYDLGALPAFPGYLVKPTRLSSFQSATRLGARSLARILHQKEIDSVKPDRNHRRKLITSRINYDEVYVIYRFCRWPAHS